MPLRYIIDTIHDGIAEVNYCTYLLLGMLAGISSGTD